MSAKACCLKLTEFCKFGLVHLLLVFQAEESSSSSSTSSSEDVGFMIGQRLRRMLNPSNAWQDTDVEEGVAQGRGESKQTVLSNPFGLPLQAFRLAVNSA